MYLSDRDLAWSIETGKLIVDPRPEKIDASSIDLHLDRIEDAQVWDMGEYCAHQKSTGVHRPELRIGSYNLADFSRRYLRDPPPYDKSPSQFVGIRGSEIVIKPGGFLLWQTRETVGTPDTNADLICFVDGKSTKARAGIVVHLTAPTIHTSWRGKITLEIANLGPFDIVLEAGDCIAQIIVARVTSPPHRGVMGTSATYGQTSVDGTKSRK